MIMWFLRLSCVLLITGIVESYKILLISPISGKSLVLLTDSIAKYLADAGHECLYWIGHSQLLVIDVLWCHPLLEISASYAVAQAAGDKLSIQSQIDRKAQNQDIKMFFSIFLENARTTISNEAVQDLLKDKSQHFDVIVAQWLFIDVYAGFAAVYDCPLIWFLTVEPHWMVLRLIDEATNPAYSTDVLAKYLSTPLSFVQRLGSLYDRIYTYYLYHSFVYNTEEEIYNKYMVPHVNSQKYTPLDVLRYNASLMLGNSHVSLGEASSLPQSYKPIGGYHIERDVKPLPDNIKKIMDDAKHGVIYFSMGSNLKSRDFPEELKKKLLKFLGGLNQTVIWKFEEELPNRPSNVHIVSWAPQQSILAHPNCVLFISHGGLLSTTEAIHFGVPLVGIPVFADQFINVERAVIKGFAKKVQLTSNLAEDLKEQVENILSDPIYTTKVKELSFIYHDRPVTPGAELVHWVEHVVKTRGAPHLRSPTLHLPLYQKLYLDLLASLLLLTLSAVLLIRKMYSMLFFPPCIDNKKLN
ncbi:UDP-glycosyltransferase UGT5-like isoform X5 [Leptidea sinapis]|uniref:UDP-glycosyltransferase UGT5-like isoform X5 n=1 Tax=Leptidea sinapis TaxID=189913 RepID=UPI0021C336A5|nr:UDP-glycosyltransferase UGT5-like isoform X5 [Leptidea sinapis]